MTENEKQGTIKLRIATLNKLRLLSAKTAIPMSKIVDELLKIVDVSRIKNAERCLLQTSFDPDTHIMKSYVSAIYSGCFKVTSDMTEDAINDRLKEIIEQAKGEN